MRGFLDSGSRRAISPAGNARALWTFSRFVIRAGARRMIKGCLSSRDKATAAHHNDTHVSLVAGVTPYDYTGIDNVSDQTDLFEGYVFFHKRGDKIVGFEDIN